jgi:hypothetical protein
MMIRVVGCLGILVSLPWLAAAQSALAPPQVNRSIASYEDLLSGARTVLRNKNPKEAVRLSEDAIALDDKRWEAYVVAASGYSGQQLYDDAIGMLQMALIHAPQDRKDLVRDAIAEARQSSKRDGTLAAAPKPSPADVAGPSQAESVLWKSIENSSRVEDFRAYLQKYPTGTFSPLASVRIEKLDAEAATAKAKAEESKIKLDKERASAAEAERFTFPVIHLRARVTFSNNPGGFGHLRITPEAVIYEGDDENITIPRAEVTYMDTAKTGIANFLRLHTAEGNWSFAAVDEADVRRHKFDQYYPTRLGDAFVQRWGFTPADGNKRLIPGH